MVCWLEMLAVIWHSVICKLMCHSCVLTEQHGAEGCECSDARKRASEVINMCVC